jgi:putative flippase GtrA
VNSLSLSQRFTELLRRKPVIVQILRFAAIGSLNTALDFVILNFLFKTFEIDTTSELFLINGINFSFAVIQSYFWNRAWAFTESQGLSLFQNAFRLMLVGSLGAFTLLAVFIGLAFDPANTYFLLIFVGLISIELVLWKAFNLKLGQTSSSGIQFLVFVVASALGALINSGILALAAHIITPYLEFTINSDYIKNIAKVIATAVSLVWNFTAYKLIVFKR